MDKIETPRELLNAVIAEVAASADITPDQIRGWRYRNREVVEARAMVARRLLARGISEDRIAKMMHVRLETVQVYLGRRTRQRPLHTGARDVV